MLPSSLWPVARPKCVCNSKIHGYVPRRVDLGDNRRSQSTYIPLKKHTPKKHNAEVSRTVYVSEFLCGGLGYVARVRGEIIDIRDEILPRSTQLQIRN